MRSPGRSTGLRRIESRRIDKSGKITFRQHKTGNVVTVRFSVKALKWIQRHQQHLVIPNPHTQKWFCEHFARLVARAGIREGTFKWLRRTAGSYADQARHGNGPKLLGHASRRVFDQSYNVREITEREPVEPPKL